MRRRLLAVPVIVAGILSLASPAQAAVNRPVAVWQMNEAAGSRTMVDSSGNGINGTIGAEVLAGTALSGGGTGYRFPYLTPNQPPAHPEHLARVAHRSALNPGSGDYAVELRMRTTRNFGNVVQKGQSGAAGGMWKFQQPNGEISCLFWGSAGSSGTSSGAVRVNDGQWHVVRCERTSTGVTMFVDGVVVGRNRNRSGTISNTWPITIAGKGSCDQIKVTCDYFVGDLDYVKIETS